MIQIENLTKLYSHHPVLQDLSLHLESDRIIGLLGPNGSGKTTLLKILNGLIRHYQGFVGINGKAPGIESRQMIAYLPDEPYFEDWMKASDAIRLFSDFYPDFDTAKCLGMMQRFQLTKDMKIKTMSKGMKEKFQLCLVMSRHARIYILDEPIAGVDPASRDAIIDTILGNYEPGALMLIATHLVSDLETIFDEVLMMSNGQIILHENAEKLRAEKGMSIDHYFREVFRC